MRLFKQNGQSLIEILLAVALAMVLLPALLTGFVASREGKAQEGQRLQAVALMKEMEEAVRSVREKGWNNIATDGTYYPVAGSSWSLASGIESVAGTDFIRQLVISSVTRDSNGNIGVGTIDPSTKKIDYTVSWTNPNPGSITTSEYLERYLGNATKTHTSVADFTSGATFSNTEVIDTGGGDGTVRLKSATASATWTDDFLQADAANYNYGSSKIELVSSAAQLKNNGSPVSGQTTNSSFDTTLVPWSFILYGWDNKQTGVRKNSGGIPGGYASITFPKGKTNSSGGYFVQSFTTTTNNPAATLTFNWSVPSHNPPRVSSFHLYAWIDSSGTGTPTNIVWDSGDQNNTTPWSGTVSVNASSYLTTAGTYYLKIGGYVVYANTNSGPVEAGFDNVLLSWSGTRTAYATDSPTVYPKSSFTPTLVTQWTGFSTTEILNGGSVRYQLSDDNGSTWKFWNGSIWATASGATDYNTAAQINTNIGTFPVAAGRILVKTFLISNGSQLVGIDKIDITYIGTGSGPNSGTYTQIMDIGSQVAFNRIIWNPTSQPAGTSANLQIATSADNSTWSPFVSPDVNGALPLDNVLGRYLKYQWTFNSTNTSLPTITDMTVNYSP